MKVQNYRRERVFSLFIIVMGLFIDQISKRLAFEHLRNSPVEKFLWETVRLMYTENTGGFGSLGSDWSEVSKIIFLKLLPLIILSWMAVMIFRGKLSDRNEMVGYALILSGGLSNLIDRFYSGFVIDYLYVGIGPIGTHIFNLADVFITFGVSGLLLSKSWECTRFMRHNN